MAARVFRLVGASGDPTRAQRNRCGRVDDPNARRPDGARSPSSPRRPTPTSSSCSRVDARLRSTTHGRRRRATRTASLSSPRWNLGDDCRYAITRGVVTRYVASRNARVSTRTPMDLDLLAEYDRRRIEAFIEQIGTQNRSPPSLRATKGRRFTSRRLPSVISVSRPHGTFATRRDPSVKTLEEPLALSSRTAFRNLLAITYGCCSGSRTEAGPEWSPPSSATRPLDRLD